MGSFRKIYWQSSGMSVGAQVVLLIAAISALVAVEVLQKRQTTADYGQMLAASRQSAEGLEWIGRWRSDIEPVDPEVDPLRTGVIGVAASPVTSIGGHLPSKQASVNPNWAAVIVRLLREAGVRKGDVVAVAVSGSFPALNLATYCAIEQIDARPIIILSASASQWGANIPDLLWVDMARRLREAGVIRSRAVAASLGGREDRGVGLPDEGLETLRSAVEQAGIDLLEPSGYEDAVSRRIALYASEADVQPVRALINIGGGTATTGPEGVDHLFDSGLITSAPPRAFTVPSVMGHFLEQEVPVIHLSGIETLAARFGLPYPPKTEPRVGEGGIYRTTTYRRWLAAVLALALVGLVYFLSRTGNLGSVFGQPREDANHGGPSV